MKFSIGETAKLTRVTIQTLRHYDKEGLLKPSYVDDETKYRYYSIDQFQQIDFIKRCKALGFSLEKIKSILYDENSLENILDSITFQKYVIQIEIEKLEKIRTDLERLENNLEHALERLDKDPEIEEINFFILGNYKSEMKNIAHIEDSIRKVLKDFKIPHSIIDTLIVLKVNKANPLVYEELLIASYIIKSEVQYSSTGISVYAEGQSFENQESFSKIENYKNKNNIISEDNYFEIYHISKLDSKNKEYSLINIFSPFK
ncbi:MAG: MerR family transcriptional regulator [Cetobacterium sp.]|uniref:MerR family transcriptional regulator n=1 Tax=Cetobacterium sp. TaxID=2071632 RepID=UPI003F3604EF